MIRWWRSASRTRLDDVTCDRARSPRAHMPSAPRTSLLTADWWRMRETRRLDGTSTSCRLRAANLGWSGRFARTGICPGFRPTAGGSPSLRSTRRRQASWSPISPAAGHGGSDPHHWPIYFGSIAWSPSGDTLLYTAGDQRRLVVLDLGSGRESSLAPSRPLGWLNNPVFSPGGRELVVAGSTPDLFNSLWRVTPAYRHVDPVKDPGRLRQAATLGRRRMDLLRPHADNVVLRTRTNLADAGGWWRTSALGNGSKGLPAMGPVDGSKRQAAGLLRVAVQQ